MRPHLARWCASARAFLVVFTTSSRLSLDYASSLVADIQHCCPNVPFALVGVRANEREGPLKEGLEIAYFQVVSESPSEVFAYLTHRLDSGKQLPNVPHQGSCHRSKPNLALGFRAWVAWAFHYWKKALLFSCVRPRRRARSESPR